jgi:replicative DNA helicase
MSDANTKSIPLNLEAEEAVLGSILIDPDVILAISDKVKARDFWAERHQWIYEAAMVLHEARKPVDFLTICDELERVNRLSDCGGASYITQLINNVPSAAYAEHYAGIVREMSIRRQLVDAASKLVEEAFDLKKSPEAVMSEHLTRITGYEVGRKGTEPTLVGKSLAELLDIVAGGGLPSLPTGFRDFDTLLRGGLHPGHLIVLAARPGIGKTTAMLNMAFNGASDKQKPITSAFFCLEMSKVELAGRLMSIAGLVPNDIFVDPKAASSLTDQNWSDLMQIAGVVSEAQIILDDTPGLYLGELYSKLRKLKAQYDIKVAYVDYLQLIQVEGNYQSRVQEVGQISKSLKRYARELDICIVAAAQMSRAVEGRTDGIPVLSDLRESGNIEQDADVVVFLYREDLVKKSSTRANLVDMIVAKNRHGTLGTATVYYRGQFLKFSNIEVMGAIPGIPNNVENPPTNAYSGGANGAEWDQADIYDMIENGSDPGGPS